AKAVAMPSPMPEVEPVMTALRGEVMGWDPLFRGFLHHICCNAQFNSSLRERRRRDGFDKPDKTYRMTRVSEEERSP
ncbi:MAG: hypothetical protein KAH44_04630, partial [Oricola sp.]|nr:hypothetical protein [Oricola sp.]